jgi:4-carboxymuconolactone decarboxylase
MHEVLTSLVVPEAEHAGYVAKTDDDRFIGPFNALIRVPRIASGIGQWTGQITAFGLSEEVREAVIRTVGAHWGAGFEIYAHVAGARTAGLPEEAITAILDGRPPSDLGPGAEAAQRLTASLLAHHRVPDEIYAAALSAFGEDASWRCCGRSANTRRSPASSSPSTCQHQIGRHGHDRASRRDLR